MKKIKEAIDPRTELWNRLVSKYEKDNPVKFSKKKANGEFDKIPATFKGKVSINARGIEVIE